ncbi:MAG: hypothetical protein RL160_1511 [Bacteroidota bacterium]
MKNTSYLGLFLLLVAAATNAQAQLQNGKSIYGEAAYDLSGESVSMPDSVTIAIGAHGNDGNGTNSGHVRVFAWNGSSWSQKGSDINGEAASDESGTSVSMPDARTIAIGAPRNDGGTTDAGHVRVYRWNGSAWVQKGADIDGAASNEFFGISVSMPDSITLAIGAYGSNANGTSSGRVRIYTWNGSAWVSKGSNIPGKAAGDNAGVSVSMPDANTVAIGAHLNDGGGSNSGHARVFSWNGSTWVQKGGDINGAAAQDRCGFSVSMPNANTLAVGAPLNSGNGTYSGHTRVFSWNGSAWQLKGSAINGDNAGNWAGYAVNMPSADMVAIGAFYCDGKFRDVGQAKVFKWNGSGWTQKGNDIMGDTTDDYLGRSVSMPDEKTLGVSAPYNGKGGVMIGQVKIFDMCSSAKTLTLTRCNQMVSPSGKFTWTQNGTYTDIIPNAQGCDSLITVHLTITKTAPPTGSDTQTFCNSATISDLNASGSSVQWYDTVRGGSPLSATSTLTNGKTYYASQSISGCESDTRLAVLALINTPAAPSGSKSQSFCNSATIADLFASGSSIQWYDTANAGIPFATNTSLADGKKYYATQSIGGCESNTRLEVRVTIQKPAAPSVAASQTFCNHATIAELVVSGSAVQWYDTANGGVALANNTSLKDGTKYYASQTLSGCESQTRAEVTVTILMPTAPAGSTSQTFCNKATIADLIVNGSVVLWYDTASTGIALPTTTTLTDGKIYHASQTISGCESSTRLAVTVSILLPAAPTGLATQAFCNSATVDDLTATGASIRWYETSVGGNALSGTSVLKNGSSYHASQTISGCEGNTRLTVAAKINSVTDITTSLSGNTITANNDSARYVWLDCDNNFAVIPGQTSKRFVPVANGNYAVQLTQNGCMDTSACVTVNTLALEDRASEAAPRVYPNPSNGTFTLYNDHSPEGILVEIHDTRGRSIVRQSLLHSNTITFSLKEPAGIYILTLQSPDEKSVVRLEIE